jgi:hypothetical protein
MIIGELNGNSVELGYTSNGFCYKNYEAFDAKSDEICYIPEYGLDDENPDTITENTSVYRYKDILKLCEKHIKENGLSGSPTEMAKDVFEMLDWQHPTTLLDEWYGEEEDDIEE